MNPSTSKTHDFAAHLECDVELTKYDIVIDRIGDLTFIGTWRCGECGEIGAPSHLFGDIQDAIQATQRDLLYHHRVYHEIR